MSRLMNGSHKNLITAMAEYVPSNFQTTTRLDFLYLVVFGLEVVGSFLCLLIAKLFNKYNISHANFSPIMNQILIALAVNNLLQRGYKFTFRLGDPDQFHADTCIRNLSMSSLIAMFLLGTTFFMLIERAFATTNFTKYENEDYSKSINQVFGIVWIILGFFIFLNVVTTLVSISTRTYYQCLVYNMQQDPLKINWQLLLLVLCMAVFCTFFVLLMKVNVDKRNNMNKPGNNYKLSYSFQLRENSKSMKMMIGFSVLFMFFISLYLYQTYAVYNKINLDDLREHLEYFVFRQELCLIPIPLFTVVMPLMLIKTTDSLKSRLRSLWTDYRRYRKLPGQQHKISVDP